MRASTNRHRLPLRKTGTIITLQHAATQWTARQWRDGRGQTRWTTSCLHNTAKDESCYQTHSRSFFWPRWSGCLHTVAKCVAPTCLSCEWLWAVAIKRCGDVGPQQKKSTVFWAALCNEADFSFCFFYSRLQVLFCVANEGILGATTRTFPECIAKHTSLPLACTPVNISPTFTLRQAGHSRKIARSITSSPGIIAKHPAKQKRPEGSAASVKLILDKSMSQQTVGVK